MNKAKMCPIKMWGCEVGQFVTKADYSSCDEHIKQFVFFSSFLFFSFLFLSFFSFLFVRWSSSRLVHSAKCLLPQSTQSKMGSVVLPNIVLSKLICCSFENILVWIGRVRLGKLVKPWNTRLLCSMVKLRIDSFWLG